MKKRFIKSFGLIAGAALSLSLFAACGEQPAQTSYDSGVVKAFHAVTPAGDLVSQTAVTDGQEYLVTVITSSSVSEYRVDSEFQVGAANTIVGDAPVLTAAQEDAAAVSDLERAFEEALRLSGIDKTEVEGFDFDRDTYMGKAVYKVEIEDAAAEYSYTFDVTDFSLLASKTELKNTAPAGDGSSYIGEAKAKEIALGAVGIGEADAEGFTLKSMPESGRRLYEASFNYEGFRYTVDIDALSGEIVKLSKNILDESATYPEIPQAITEEEAKAIALNFAFPEGADAKQVQFRKVKLDYEKGRFVYEVEFVAEGNEYEFEISASDGAILDVEIDAYDEEELPQTGAFLSREEAVRIVRGVAGDDAFVLDVEIEVRRLSGEKRYFYEIEVRVNGREIEYYVDAITGEISANDDYTGNPADPTPAITKEQALQIALDDFGLNAAQITYQRIELERENGRLCYEIKLFAGKAEYKMSVDAHSGAIVEREIDLEHEEEMPPQSPEGTFITREQAIDAVKAYFTGKGKNVRIDEEVEWEDEGTGANKRYYFEVEAYVDGREYECYVDAVTGEVRVKGEMIGEQKALIGEQKALEIALQYYSLTQSEVRVSKVKLKEDDGILIYEVEFKVKDLEYEFEIDAETGKILDVDRSFD